MELSTDQAFLDSYKRLAKQRNYDVADYSCAVHAFRWVVDTMPQWFWWAVKDRRVKIMPNCTVRTMEGIAKPGDWVVAYSGGTLGAIGAVSHDLASELLQVEAAGK